MRKVLLTMDEQIKYETIKELADHPHGNKKRAALKLGCTVRHINRLIQRYRIQGKSCFSHGNKGRKPASTIPDSLRAQVRDLYQKKYYDANFTHFTELLASKENISLSVSTVASILEEHFILSPLATKAKKRRIRKILRQRQTKATGVKETVQIQSQLVALEDAHPRRPRAKYAGELIQMDASSFVWFGKEKTTLHVAVDDATGMIVGAWFDKEETLNGYYHVFSQILHSYGIPYKFLTDRRTVFTFKKKNSPSLEEDTFTQFAYACHQLGVDLETTSVPQAKGRVERLNATLQTRLPIELRLEGVSSISEANEFLNSHIKEFNAKIALPFNHNKSVFAPQPSDEKINLILSILTERTVDNGHAIRFMRKYYQMRDAENLPVFPRPGTKVMVIQAFDGNLYCNVNDQDIYALMEIPPSESISQAFDFAEKAPDKPKKKYIPPMNHPWRKFAFRKFADSQPHR